MRTTIPPVAPELGGGHLLCVDCGTPVSIPRGPDAGRDRRCRACNGAYIRLMVAKAMQSDDEQLVGMVDGESLNTSQLARRLGISRPAADRRLRGARARLALLLTKDALDEGVFV